MQVVLPQGRLLNEALNFVQAMGIDLPQPDSRELLAQNHSHKLLLSKPVDVPLYVDNGMDLGITGRDAVEEQDADVFIPLKLPFGSCRLSVAVPRDNEQQLSSLQGKTIATEYPSITKRYFSRQEMEIEVLDVTGSTELAPISGLADGIVDIVETGSTLQANNLVAIEQIMEISALLVVNRISQKTKFEQINVLISTAKGVSAEPHYVRRDLLSPLEHGDESEAWLFTTCDDLAEYSGTWKST